MRSWGYECSEDIPKAERVGKTADPCMSLWSASLQNPGVGNRGDPEEHSTAHQISEFSPKRWRIRKEKRLKIFQGGKERPEKGEGTGKVTAKDGSAAASLLILCSKAAVNVG